MLPVDSISVLGKGRKRDGNLVRAAMDETSTKFAMNKLGSLVLVLNRDGSVSEVFLFKHFSSKC